MNAALNAIVAITLIAGTCLVAACWPQPTGRRRNGTRAPHAACRPQHTRRTR